MDEFLYQLKCLLAWLLGHASPPDHGLNVRGLEPSDESLTFFWRGDRAVVTASVSQQAPTRQEHKEWMAARLHGEEHRTFLILRGKHPVGMFTITMQTAVRCSLGYMVGPEFRGQGIAKSLRLVALDFIRRNVPEANYVESRIRVGNVRSIKTAIRTGATLLGEPANGFIRYEQALR